MSGSAPTAGFRDLFSRDAAGYARFRPRYPAALFEWLAALPVAHRLAWDCGTGSGQAATMLAPHFERVVGSDASPAQLHFASRAARVHYAAFPAEAGGLAPGVVDLVTVAQAFHWLDHTLFYAEVERVAAPGAALAIWGYDRLQVSPAIDGLIGRFHDETVGPYWPLQRKQIMQQYRRSEIPIAEVVAPSLAIEASLTLPELLGYLRTWSAVNRYVAAHGRDPVAALEPELVGPWGDPESPQRIVWPLFVRAGRWLGISGEARSRLGGGR